MPEPPSTWYIQISYAVIPKPALETKIYFPSGAHEGETKSLPGSFETCFGSLPSGFMIQMLSLPSRSERNAIHFPSGENLGWLSNAIPPEISFACPPSIGGWKVRQRNPKRLVLPRERRRAKATFLHRW